jgi:hypothetical protein
LAVETATLRPTSPPTTTLGTSGLSSLSNNVVADEALAASTKVLLARHLHRRTASTTTLQSRHLKRSQKLVHLTHVDLHHHQVIPDTLTTTHTTAMTHPLTTTEVAEATAADVEDHGAAATISPPADCPTAHQLSCKT